MFIKLKDCVVDLREIIGVGKSQIDYSVWSMILYIRGCASPLVITYDDELERNDDYKFVIGALTDGKGCISR